MAEASVPKKTLAETLELLEKQVQCPICLETYRDPKALACLHTYCQECIQQLLLKQQRDQEVECPQCRSVVAVAGNDASSLPTVFFINGLIDVYHIMKKAESDVIGCQNCSETKSTSFCHTCGFICASCTNDHKKKKVYEGHKIVQISKMREGALIQLPTKKAPTSICQKHEGKRCKLYCFQCEQLICKDCTLVGHAGHKLDFVKSVANAYREEVLSSLVPLRDTHASVTMAIASVEDSKREIRDQGGDIATTITLSFKELRTILDKHEQLLLQQAQEIVGRKVDVLDSQKEDLQLAVATLDSLVGFIKRTAENASDEEFISIKQQMTSRVQEVGNKYECLELGPAEVANIGRVMPQADSLHELCQKQSAVYISVVDASKCVVTGPGLKFAFTKKVAEFTVCTHDTHGQPSPVQQHVSAELKSLVDESVLQATVVSQTPSTYKLSYTPTSSGHHQLTVRVSNTEIGTFQVLVHNSVEILICGNIATGKSALVNSIIGEQVAEESNKLFLETTTIVSYQCNIEVESSKTVHVKVWDTPGLGDPFGDDEATVKEIAEKCKPDLLVYCLDMRGRLRTSDITGIKLLTEALHQPMWKHSIFVLTFANKVKDEDTLKERVSSYADAIRRCLKCPNDIADNITVIPAGYCQCQPPGIDDWLSQFWAASFMKGKHQLGGRSSQETALKKGEAAKLQPCISQ